MGKIYEALERAQQEVGGRERLPGDLLTLEDADAPRRAAAPRPRAPVPSMEDEMLELHHALEGLLDGTTGKIVEFIACREGEGVSTITEEFARTCATRLGKRVLILDAAVAARDAGTARRDAWDCEEPRRESPWEIAAHERGDPRIRTGLIRDDPRALAGSNGGPPAGDPWRRVRAEFDLVLIDAPPAHVSSVGVALASKADGTVVVMEAEKTRVPVVESLSRRITKTGGRVLGIVLNCRRYHIPEFICRRI
jgi:Mrp family chromosome partitioning ATPase